MPPYDAYLNNPLFKTRYIDRNAWFINLGNFFSESKQQIYAKIKANPFRAIYLAPLLLGVKFLNRIYTSRHSKDIKRKVKSNPLKIAYLVPFYLLSKILWAKSWERNYPYWRIRRGKVDMPYFELVLTTRCSLRCESCNNLMQYFDSKSAYTCSLQGISNALDTLFGVVDSIGSVRIIGGEPLLFKDIAKVVEKLENEPKVKSFNLVTNGTIRFKDELLDALADSKKAKVYISDYSKSPNLTTKLYQKDIIESLENRSIAYNFVFANEGDSWIEPGKIYKRNRNKEDIIRNFKSCLMPCVSIMSNEGIPAFATAMGGGESPNPHNINHNSTNTKSTDIRSSGQIFICPIASSLSRLKGLDEFRGDFVELDSTLTKQKILDFYAQDFFQACDYCHDMWKYHNKIQIPIAIQTKRVLKMEKD